jgi:thiosulfate reductase cytochrome b subunit
MPPSTPESSSTQSRKNPPSPKQDWWIKISHGLTIVSLTILIMSGLQIYNANPVFGGRAGWHFPNYLLLGGWLGGGRNWHFAAIWVFSMNLLIYGIYIGISQRWKKRFVADSDLKAIKTGQNQKRKNYAWHRIAYTAIIPVLILSIGSGLAMYKPAQLPWLATLFGHWQTLRTIHFMTVPIAILFLVIHVALGLKVGGLRLIRSMFI